jgi:hypothetical protein
MRLQLLLKANIEREVQRLLAQLSPETDCCKVHKCYIKNMHCLQHCCLLSADKEEDERLTNLYLFYVLTS